MALCAGFFCRKIRILEVGSVTGLACDAFGDVLIGTHLRGVGCEGRQENIAARSPIPSNFVSEFNGVMLVLLPKPPVGGFGLGKRISSRPSR